MSEVWAWAIATGSLLGWALLQPTAAATVGAFAAGYAIGASKNRAALTELFRGVGAGLVAGLIVWGVQTIIRGGA